jgi:ATP-binding cassette subfamily C protein
MPEPARSSLTAPGLRAEAGALTRAFLAFAGWRAAWAAGLIALGSVFDGLGLLFLVPVLALVIGDHAGRPSGRIAGAIEGLLGGYPPGMRLLIVLLAFAGLMLVRGAVLRRRDRATETLQLEFVEDVRLRLVRKLTSAGWPAVAGASHARVLQALSVEIHQVGVASSAGLLAAVAAAMLIGHCILALVLAPLAGALAIAFALMAALISRPYLVRSKRLGRTIIEAHVGMAEGAAAFMGGLKLALAQGMEDRFVEGYAAAAAASVRDRVQFQDLQSRLRNLTSGAAALVGAVTLFVGVELFRLPAAVLITLLVVLSRMGALAATVQQGLQQVAHSLPGYAAILAIETELEPPGRAPSAPIVVPRLSGADAALVFNRVDYAHDPAAGRSPELSQASLTIPSGAFIGVVGPSGVGKTTFLDLAAGVLRPQSGSIHAFGQELGGQEPGGEALARHRERLAYVAQDPFLFDDTVRANLAWAAPGRSEADRLEALQAVGGEGLLQRLSDGLDTRIGHRGALLSAGERQRVALACGILRRPELFLLDEATNAIDVAAEEMILRAIWALCPRATILMVAHRAESLRFCDEILEFPGPVFRSGGLSGRGWRGVS